MSGGRRSDLRTKTGRRVAILSYSDGLHDARSLRLARTLRSNGHDVVIYARATRGLPPLEYVEGTPVHRIAVGFVPPVRVLIDAVDEARRAGSHPRLALLLAPMIAPAVTFLWLLGVLSMLGANDRIPHARPGWADKGRAAAFWLFGMGPWRRRVRAVRALFSAAPVPIRRFLRHVPLPMRLLAALHKATSAGLGALARWIRRREPGRVARARHLRIVALRRWIRGAARAATQRVAGPLFAFPLRPLAWAAALEALAAPADVVHGMWAGSLPGVVRLGRRDGAAMIYDSRDVYLHSRVFGHMGRIPRAILLRFERIWAAQVDQVITVNAPYAAILRDVLQIPLPVVVMNCPFRQVSRPATNVIRERLKLSASTRVVLYTGGLMTERGIEQGMAAITQVDDAVLVLLGHGSEAGEYAKVAGELPYRGRVFVLPPVPAGELLAWTASADVMLSVIQPTTLNHRYSTPQKVLEALAVGTPIVASDLPGTASIVSATGSGILVDPTNPAAVAAGIRALLDVPSSEARRRRSRIRAAGRRHYTWEAQEVALLSVYSRLLLRAPLPRAAQHAATGPSVQPAAVGA
jgi:glycosyltransferase involved in cell wall biosynthesis